MKSSKSTKADRQRLPWLDLIRGAAIIWIFLVHFVERFMAGSFFANPSGSWPSLADRIAQLALLPVSGAPGVFINVLRYIGWLGDQGVQIFLVASGFGLTFAILKKGEPIHAREFYEKRLFAILPLWWAAHVLFIGLSILVNGKLRLTDWRTFASLLGFRFLPEVQYYFSASWWFIGLLLQLYLIFPFLYRLLERMKPVRFFLVVGGVSVLVRLAGLLALHRYLDWWSRGGLFVFRLPEFAFGMSFAALFLEDTEKINRWTTSPAAVLAWLGVYLAGNLLSFTLWGMSVAFLLTGAAAFVLLYGLTSRIQRPPTGVFIWTGRHSYAIFLVHHPVLAFLVSRTLSLDASVKILVLLGLAAIITVIVAISLEVATNAFVKNTIQLAVYRTALVVAASLVLALSAEAQIRVLEPQEVLCWGGTRCAGTRPGVRPSPETQPCYTASLVGL